MNSVSSLSGGKTSSYMAVNFPTDYNIFALVTTNDKKCIFPDSKIRQIVSDKIGREFIGTLEMDDIIYTMLDLEQLLGTKINWVAGKTFDEIIIRNEKKYLPNVTQRFCTVQLKLRPIFDFWINNIKEPVLMNIGFRANEMTRAKKMIDKTNDNGFLEFETIVGKRSDGKNKWKKIPWQKPNFPLIENKIFKDKINEFWKNKNVRFAHLNNCVGCFHRNEILLKYMSIKHPNKFDWFCNQEQSGYNNSTFKIGITYKKIKEFNLQYELFDDDFSSCDSGYCGL